MKKTALVIMAAGIQAVLEKESKTACTSRTKMVRSLWIIPFMMS